MNTGQEKSCLFVLLCLSFVNVHQFMCASFLLGLRVGCVV